MTPEAAADQLLDKLLRRVHDSLPITARSAPAYFLQRLCSTEARSALHARLRNAEAQGAVRLKWSREMEIGGELVRIHCLDRTRLALWLGYSEPPSAPDWDVICSKIADRRLAQSLVTPKAFGQLKRLARNDPRTACLLLEQAAAVIARLPAQGLPLANLAAEVLGDAHALDTGKGVARIVLNAFACAEPISDERESDRTRWARLGVLVGELNRPALVLNLPAIEGTPAGTLAETARVHGEPLHLSLRVLLRAPPRWQAAGRDIFVCENPSIVALAAAKLGRDCAPLVCTDGNPAAAQLALLDQLRSAGARLRYHGDFDWDGLRIGNRMMSEYGADPWRFSTRDYRPIGQVKLGEQSVSANWDSELHMAMLAAGTALHEEAIADVLLSDLSREQKNG